MDEVFFEFGDDADGGCGVDVEHEGFGFFDRFDFEVFFGADDAFEELWFEVEFVPDGGEFVFESCDVADEGVGFDVVGVELGEDADGSSGSCVGDGVSAGFDVDDVGGDGFVVFFAFFFDARAGSYLDDVVDFEGALFECSAEDAAGEVLDGGSGFVDVEASRDEHEWFFGCVAGLDFGDGEECFDEGAEVDFVLC